jgi:hypothetical protein
LFCFAFLFSELEAPPQFDSDAQLAPFGVFK